jgi:multisubunit Na+/H+ antiporter MnhF subunit
MSTIRQFKNREPNRINLFKWSKIGLVIGLLLAVITCVEFGFDWNVIIGYSILGPVASIAFRKWIFRIFWA